MNLDEKLRVAERSLDPDEIRRATLYAPAEMLHLAYRRLQERLIILQRAVIAMEEIMPRCWCGEVGEPLCVTHAYAVTRYAELRAYHERSGQLTKWQNGMLGGSPLKDVKQFVQTWHDLGRPGYVPGQNWQERRCAYPDCATEGRMWSPNYCQNHSTWGLVNPVKSLAKPRGASTAHIESKTSPPTA